MRPGRFALARGALIALLLAVGIPARADDPGTVVLSLDAGAPGLAERLRAELASLGFKVVEVEPAGHAVPLDLVARQARAVAAIRIASASADVEVWVADRMTGKTLLRHVSAGQGNASIPAADIALQAVELLRASLLELGSGQASREEVTPPARLEARLAETGTSRRSAHRLGFALGPGLLVSRGGLPASGHVLMQLDRGFGEGLQAHVLASLPVLPSQISADEGSANIATTLVGGGLDLRPLQPGACWQAQAGAGVSLLWLQMQGVGTPPFTGTAADVLAGAPYLRLGLSLCLTGGWLLALDGLSGYALAQPVMRFVGREIAVFGRPFVLAALGVRLQWP
jgi:hypothetical protein